MGFLLMFINDKQGFIILSQFCQSHGLNPLPDARRSNTPHTRYTHKHMTKILSLLGFLFACSSGVEDDCFREVITFRQDRWVVAHR